MRSKALARPHLALGARQLALHGRMGGAAEWRTTQPGHAKRGCGARAPHVARRTARTAAAHLQLARVVLQDPVGFEYLCRVAPGPGRLWSTTSRGRAARSTALPRHPAGWPSPAPRTRTRTAHLVYLLLGAQLEL
jgi:hypothetical protein